MKLLSHVNTFILKERLITKRHLKADSKVHRTFALLARKKWFFDFTPAPQAELESGLTRSAGATLVDPWWGWGNNKTFFR